MSASVVVRALALLAAAGAASAADTAPPQAAQPGPDETRAIVADMLADSQSRSSLLQGADAGHDGSFFIAGEGFRLNVGGMLQFRYMTTFRDDDAGDDFEPGFQASRTRLNFDGVINESWLFKIRGQFDKEGGEFGLLDAWVMHKFANGVVAGWGQIKAPIMREDIVEDSYQLSVDRAVTTDFFRPDRVQGVWLHYAAEDWRAWASFNDGAASLNSDYTSDPADFALTGRAEYKFAGEWKQFDDFTSRQGDAFAALLGAAAHYQQSPNTNNPTDVDVGFLLYTADVSFEGDGWNAFASFVGTHAEVDTLSTDKTERDEFGLVVQGGFRVAPETEIFGRWDGIFADDEARGTDNDNFNFITVGVNQYFAGHAAKGTIDVLYSLDETDDLTSAAYSGFLPKTNQGLLGDTDDGEFAIRLQFQLLF